MTEKYPYDLILFDLDGTLIETAPEIADAVNDTLQRFDLPPVTQQQVNDWIGHGTRTLLIQALAEVGHTTVEAVQAADNFPQIEAAFGVHYEQRCGTRSHLYPHVRETLQALRAEGVKLVVMTNKEGRYTQVVLDAHQMAPLFDRVISGDTLPVKKPNPAGIFDCLKQFSVSSERTLFVGDSSIDVATARNANVTVWALPYGYNMGEAIESCHPDRVISDLSALTAGLVSAV
ncbi:MAG: HAD-IA family hydrolase [Hydrogenophaga sp.]|uniref:HAD-IA family hydrolase n=1 Tax=Hydrogenophaga sp. TaxID=1904254 RepID=UPI002727E079|nr:HAD-IA family hydrolase [Hydrogenophaga sp.]MDO9148700.1 HAD-IA family hydrolase [Hydrogenophaga sp.]MDO9604024.1 HAD-IA family hydrolase [Hydrogenophaga sp.]MDP2164625.1 HAD-IA family hydrolase [Hydrogenophaga sp.]MDP3476365.1 HAD-IA family hydrolase [Hydrogenophaga sp.]